MISIPAPARGATINHYMVSVNHLFQFPPLREGRRILFLMMLFSRTYFNSRPCARGDQRAGDLHFRIIQFQFPPLREGRPAAYYDISLEDAISIPAPARGATSGAHEVIVQKIFQFPPLREGRPARCRSWPARCQNFNSRPCARGDGLQAVRRYGGSNFNSRPCARGDAAHSLPNKLIAKFQFPPLREGRRGGLARRAVGQHISIPAPARGATSHPRK